jgi:hypothetical protein
VRALAVNLAVLAGAVLGPSPLGAEPANSPNPSPGEPAGVVVDLGRVAVLQPEITPQMAAAVNERFRGAVDSGLIDATLVTVSASDTDQQRLVTVGECRTPECYVRLAVALKAAYLVSSWVQQAGKNYRLRLVFSDTKGAAFLDRSDTCDICTLAEAVAKLKILAQDSGRELKRRHALLPRPEPPRRKVQPKPEPERPRIRPVAPRLSPRTPAPRPTPPPPPRSEPRIKAKPSIKQAAWMSGGMGLASFVAGVTLLALDGRYTCDLEPARLRCPYRYGTGAAGATFTALGGASMVAAGVLFYYAFFRKVGRPEVPRATVSVAPTRGGAFAHAELRF